MTSKGRVLAPDLDQRLPPVFRPRHFGHWTSQDHCEDLRHGLLVLHCQDLQRFSHDSWAPEKQDAGRVQADKYLPGGYELGFSPGSGALFKGMIDGFLLGGTVGSTLELCDKNGFLPARNENWRSDQEMAIAEMTLAPPNNDEAAIVVILTPGSGRDSPGAALLEVFALNQEKEALALLAEFRSIRLDFAWRAGGLTNLSRSPESASGSRPGVLAVLYQPARH